MSDAGYRHNSADRDKILDVEQVLRSSLEYHRLRVVSPPAAVRVDIVSDQLLYFGSAAPGSDPGDAVWKVQKITITSTAIEVLWAGGAPNFSNVWNDRAALSYS